MATHARKRKYIFVRTNNTIYSVSFTDAGIKFIIDHKKYLEEIESSREFTEAKIYELTNRDNITIRGLRAKYEEIISKMFEGNTSDVYIDVPDRVFANNSLYDSNIIKLVIWNGRSRAITKGMDIPLELNIYPVGTYSTIRVPIEDYSYINLVNPEYKPIEFELD